MKRNEPSIRKPRLTDGRSTGKDIDRTQHKEAYMEANDNKLVATVEGVVLGDYQLLCSRAALGRGATRQQVYFHGYGRAQPHMTTLHDNAQRLKQRYAVRNASRYLNIKSHITTWLWKEFMEYLLTPALANKHKVKFFTQQCFVEFTKRWCQSLCKSPKQMRAWETLIMSVVSRHYEAVVAQGVGYKGSTWRGGKKQSWRW